MTNKYENILSDLIQLKREQLNLTQQEVADALSVSRQTVSKWENGYINHMSIEKVSKYSEILKLPEMAFIYPASYLELDYIDDEYINIAKELKSNNISIKNIKLYINLISEIRLDLFKNIR